VQVEAKRHHYAAHHFGMLLVGSSSGMPFAKTGMRSLKFDQAFI
jgi:hypothetical protein